MPQFVAEVFSNVHQRTRQPDEISFDGILSIPSLTKIGHMNVLYRYSESEDGLKPAVSLEGTLAVPHSIHEQLSSFKSRLWLWLRCLVVLAPK